MILVINRIFIPILVLLLICKSTIAQRYNFQQFNIEQGLIQSQTSSFAQDSHGYLWIGTMGGVSKYDGKKFINYTRSNGLANNVTLKLYIDKTDRVFIVNQSGVNVITQKGIQFFKIDSLQNKGFAANITEDEAGNIWLMYNFRLYQLKGNSFNLIQPKNTLLQNVTSIGLDGKGSLIFSVFNSGIYSIHRNELRKENSYDQLPKDQFIRTIYTSKGGITWFMSFRELFKYHNQHFTSIINSEKIRLQFFSLLIENENIWIGTNRGIVNINDKGEILNYNIANGFTDVRINQVYKDFEQNIWTATEGEGIFKFPGSMFTIHNFNYGNADVGVMSVTKSKTGGLFFGTFGRGLFYYNRTQYQQIVAPQNLVGANTINFCKEDKNGVLWVGTAGGGLWNFKNGNYVNISAQQRLPFMSFIAIEFVGEDVLLGNNRGLLKFKNYRFHEILLPGRQISCIARVGKDSTLISSDDGFYWYNSQGDVTPIKSLNNYKTSTILSIASSDKYIFLGTNDIGLIRWDKVSGELKNINEKHNLSSNAIYSLLYTKNKLLWLGTGNGLNKMTIQNNGKFAIKKFGKSEGFLPVECNQSAMIEDVDGKIWLGTTKGAYHINPEVENDKKIVPPRVEINKIRLLGDRINKELQNSDEQTQLIAANHKLSFQFNAIHLSAPDEIKYQYILEGLDKNYSPPTANDFIVYSNLPPGNYTFKVKARLNDHEVYSNIDFFSFQVQESFYQTISFKILIILALISLGIGIRELRFRVLHRRKLAIETLRAEEQFKIRKKTEQDFHDEMGNRLTRISILSEIIQNQHKHNQDLLQYITQIQENAVSLYNGTKDIIWSLNPNSDQLCDVIERLQSFGIQLFSESGVEFNSIRSLSTTKWKFQPNHSRNLMMICKEAMNNSLKHAHATSVTFNTSDDQEELIFQISDNGRGFNSQAQSLGDGLSNMKNRANRIGARLIIASEINSGTTLTVIFKKSNLVNCK